jgi:hypothetical protein
MWEDVNGEEPQKQDKQDWNRRLSLIYILVLHFQRHIL